MRASAEAWARAAQRHGFTDIHVDGALVVFRRREMSQFAIALDQPECGRDDADADTRIAGFQPLQRGHGDAHALRPGLQRLLAAQAGDSQVGAKLFDGGSSCRRKLQ